jgi:hypothetical protein
MNGAPDREGTVPLLRYRSTTLAEVFDRQRALDEPPCYM